MNTVCGLYTHSQYALHSSRSDMNMTGSPTWATARRRRPVREVHSAEHKADTESGTERDGTGRNAARPTTAEPRQILKDTLSFYYYYCYCCCYFTAAPTRPISADSSDGSTGRLTVSGFYCCLSRSRSTSCWPGTSPRVSTAPRPRDRRTE